MMVNLKSFATPQISSLSVIWSLFFALGSFILYLITVTQPSTYIDEIFHFGQCEKYCRGNFYEYDPKLTTPPGLYILTVAALTPLSILLQIDFCSLNAFRLFNFIVSQMNFILLYYMVDSRVQNYSPSKKLLISLNLSLFPLLYFYSFIYYTDVVSTFVILLTYHLFNKNHSIKAGFAGFLSITIRQTNIVWFCCFVFIKCCRLVDTETRKAGRISSKVQQRHLSHFFVILRESFILVRHSFCNFMLNILRETHLFIISALAFLYFLLKNGSIVLGDKAAHQPVMHVLQLFYFVLFTYVFAFPLNISPTINFLKIARRSKLSLLISAFIITLIVHFNTMAHLYLISDNRHYTFYIWKRIFEKKFIRYLIIPLYIISIYSIKENTRYLDGCTKLAFFTSTAITLIPQKLLEFRYFIIPYLIYRLETCHRQTRWQIFLELAFNLSVNAVTIFLFLYKPYLWPDGTIQRFSW